MPQEDPQDVGDAGDDEGHVYRGQPWVAALGGQRLVDGEREQAQVNHAPDGEHIAGRHEKDREAVGDRAGLLPVEGQGVGKAVDDDGQDDAEDDAELNGKTAFHGTVSVEFGRCVAMRCSTISATINVAR